MNAYKVERMGFGLDSTLSVLWNITGGHEIQLAASLEDERRQTKVFAETCIPLDTYELGLRTNEAAPGQPPTFHDRYKARFGPDFHIGMIEVLNVPGFTDILWHCGNDDDDTGGCLLIGSYPIITPDFEFEIAASVNRYRKIYPDIAQAIASGERCIVQYVERRPAA